MKLPLRPRVVPSGGKAMAARAYWQGHIRLALVSIPVEIYAATRSGAKISFRQIHEPSGRPISYEKVVHGVGPVDRDEILKGYELSKGNYVLLEEDEIEACQNREPKDARAGPVRRCVEIDPLYFEKPYYVVPGRRTCRRSLCRPARGAAAGEEDRARSAFAAWARIPRCDQALRQGAADGDPALC